MRLILLVLFVLFMIMAMSASGWFALLALCCAIAYFVVGAKEVLGEDRAFAENFSLRMKQSLLNRGAKKPAKEESAGAAGEDKKQD